MCLLLPLVIISGLSLSGVNTFDGDTLLQCATCENRCGETPNFFSAAPLGSTFEMGSHTSVESLIMNHMMVPGATTSK